MATTATDTSYSETSSTQRTRAGRAAGGAVAAILSIAFLFHAYWAAGGEWGAATAYGSKDLPPQAVVAAVAALIAVAVVFVLIRIGAVSVPLPERLLRWGPWALAGVFAFAALGNFTAPADSYAREWHVAFFGPLLLVIALLCALVARSPLPHDGRR